MIDTIIQLLYNHEKKNEEKSINNKEQIKYFHKLESI